MPPRAANSKKHRNGNAVRDFNECAIVGGFKNVAAYKGWFFVCRFFKKFQLLRSF